MAISIEVTGTAADWDGGRPEDVRAVCLSVAACFAEAAAVAPMAPIQIEPSNLGHPRTLFARTEAGAARILLAARGRHWCQYGYQFAHELGHVLAGMPHAEPASLAGAWLEEALCEAAPLYALAEMARRWPEHPPYRNWSDYGRHFTTYLEEYRAAHPRPAGLTFPAWLASVLPALERDPNRAADYQLVALRLAPVFSTPAAWRAVRYLHLAQPAPFPAVLERWRAAVPVSDRATVDQVARTLGVQAPRPAPKHSMTDYQDALVRLVQMPAALTDHDVAVLGTVTPALGEQGRQARAAATAGQVPAPREAPLPRKTRARRRSGPVDA